ncbi:hypothetical protein HUU05_09910 [candidate division KSB1 bacterium]|nr:hypothetical protein [candidate division KSB1 bacterium]
MGYNERLPQHEIYRKLLLEKLRDGVTINYHYLKLNTDHEDINEEYPKKENIYKNAYLYEKSSFGSRPSNNPSPLLDFHIKYLRRKFAEYRLKSEQELIYFQDYFDNMFKFLKVLRSSNSKGNFREIELNKEYENSRMIVIINHQEKEGFLGTYNELGTKFSFNGIKIDNAHTMEAIEKMLHIHIKSITVANGVTV